MTTILWDTNGIEIVKTLAAERRAAGALASGLALTLVAVAHEDQVDLAQAAATTAAAAHPCRLLLVVRRRVDADERLDAEVQVGGRLGANEAVVMRMYGRLTLHAESVLLPLLASDAPVVTWWHGEPPERLSYDALGVLAGRRITDAATSSDPIAALKRRAKDYAPGDTDLSWTRATPWRALLAAGFDDVDTPPRSATVESERGNPTAALIAGWLTARLNVPVRRVDSGGPGVTGVEVRFDGDDLLRVDRPDGYLATLTRTGLRDRQLPLKRRELGDLLAEELRRMDADQVYADALGAVTGEKDLDSRPANRTHEWVDPMLPSGRRPSARVAVKRPAKKTTARPSARSASKAAKPPTQAAVRKATKRKAADTTPAARKAAASAQSGSSKTAAGGRKSTAAKTTAAKKSATSGPTKKSTATRASARRST